MDQVTLIDETKKIAGLATDKDLADALGVKKQTVATWRSGRSWPDATQSAKIALLQGREPLAGVAAIELERHRDDPKAVRLWQSELKKVREFIFRLVYTDAFFSCSKAVAFLQQEQQPQRRRACSRARRMPPTMVPRSERARASKK